MHWLMAAPPEGHPERTPKTSRHRNNQTTKLAEAVKAEQRELLLTSIERVLLPSLQLSET